jgi:hypothetical protein
VCSFASRLAALVALACSLLPAQDFESTNEPLPPPFASTLDVGTGRGTFAVVDGALRFRERGDAGAGVEVAATTPCGRVHALTQVPSGTVVVACERGLFVCDVQHPVLDPADLRDGGPRGEVRSVVADATGRVWWCNEHELGVVDLRLRCGRRFTASDGLPPAPLQRVALGFDHRLVVVTANGTFGYRIDRGAPPALVGELPATVVANADGDATLPITVRARGGGTLRVRRKHHHMVQPLDGQLVRGLRPGRHVLEVRAFDRDLRCTVLGECTVDVPLPARFDVRWWFGAAGLAVVVVWWWAWRARPGSGFRRVSSASRCTPRPGTSTTSCSGRASSACAPTANAYRCTSTRSACIRMATGRCSPRSRSAATTPRVPSSRRSRAAVGRTTRRSPASCSPTAASG